MDDTEPVDPEEKIGSDEFALCSEDGLLGVFSEMGASGLLGDVDIGRVRPPVEAMGLFTCSQPADVSFSDTLALSLGL